MSDKRFVYRIEDQEFRLDAIEMAAIQKLRDAISAIARGATVAFGLVEIGGSDRMRASYFSPDGANLDPLLEQWNFFGKYLQREVVLTQGNAPPENRSIAIQ